MHLHYITNEAVVGCLERYETERPDEINPKVATGACVYTSPDDLNVHCIAGQIIFDLTGKVLQPDLRGTLTHDDVRAELEYLGIEIDPDAWHLLNQAQELADCRKPWGKVVDTLRFRGCMPQKDITITKDMVVECLRRYKEDRYETTNPKNESKGTCLYTSDDGQDHCIAGQVVFDLTNFAIPSSVMIAADALWSLGDWPSHITVESEATDLLKKAQVLADGAQKVPQQWGIVVSQLEDLKFI